jgi:gluconolactonase
MFAPPPNIQTTVYARLPEHYRISDRSTDWAKFQRHGEDPDSFLEGPSFDLDGNLWCTDIPYGRIFKVTPDGMFNLIVEYDGEPNGLKIHQDGRIFIADHIHGIMVMDPKKADIQPYFTRPMLERFIGVNDLVFASNGDLYFTDQGQSGLNNWNGRVFRLTSSGRLDLMLKGIPSPNGIVLNQVENMAFIAVTRMNNVWRMPIIHDDSTNLAINKVGVHVQLSGSLGGPDGLAMDQNGNLSVAHAGLGSVWLFDKFGEPIARIKSSEGVATTNHAYGGDKNQSLFITESLSGTILRAELEAPGEPMYSHQ